MVIADSTNMFGFSGAAIAGYAYFPQITHLIREHCSAGISRQAFGLWLAATLLVLVHAVAIHDAVFVALGVLQVISITLILIFSTRYHSQACPSHQTVVDHDEAIAKARH